MGLDEDFVDRAIADLVDSTVEAILKEESQRREDGVDWLIDAKLREREFLKALNDAYPDWQTTWKTPEFQAFLRQVEEDSISQYPNHIFVMDAFKRFDAPAVIRFFKIFSGGKDSARSSRPAMSREQAKKELLKLADAKKRGLWNGREAEYTKRSDALMKVIMGQSE